ncbi:Serine/threonine-protein kinase plk2, partial [Mortierella sp. GBA39]
EKLRESYQHEGRLGEGGFGYMDKVKDQDGVRYALKALKMQIMDQKDDLGSLLDARGSLTEPEVRYFGKQVTTALQHLHKLGFAHVDVKPQNLFSTDAMTIKLGDLGFAKDVEKFNYW